MGNSITVAKAATPTTTTPSLPESARRLLADPFHLGDEVPAWQPPAVLPTVKGLRAVIAELERCTQAAPNAHIEYLINTMGKSMAIRPGSDMDAALKTAGWIVACGDLPADLWTEGCTHLLRDQVFFPAPAELLKVVGQKWAERKRMLERARGLLAAHGEAAQDPQQPKPFEREPIEVRLRGMIASYRRFGRDAEAAKHEIELAKLEGREPEAWALPFHVEHAPLPPKPKPERVGSFSPFAAATKGWLADAARAHRLGQPKPPLPEAQADAPQERPSDVERMRAHAAANEPPPHDDWPE